MMQVEVIFALPDRYWRCRLDLPENATVADVLARSGLLHRIADMGLDAPQTAIFGKRVTPETLLRPGDRVELVRPLLHDPKDLRRRRARG